VTAVAEVELLRCWIQMMKLKGPVAAGITANRAFATSLAHQDLLHPPTPPRRRFRPAFHAAIKTAALEDKLRLAMAMA